MTEMTPGHDVETAETAESIESREARTAREWAEQRRAASRAHFATPSWLGDRGGDAVVPPPPPVPQQAIPQQVIPQQAAPVHDDVELAEPAVKPARALVQHATWKEKRHNRAVSSALLIAATTSTLGFGIAAIIERSNAMVIGLAVSGFLMVLIRLAMMSSVLTTVELHGSQLTVIRGGRSDHFLLTDPMHLIETIGIPTASSWRLRLETLDGRTIELKPHQVDPVELDFAVRHYQAIADQARQDRENRFRS